MWRASALAAAEDYITREWRSQGYEVGAQRYEAYGADCANLEVVIPGASRPGEIILVGAHYDSVQGSPGADDNASAVAALLEIARRLRGARPARTLRLVAFVNEEPPFFFVGEMGSGVYAKAARGRGDDIRVMFSLEMLGCYSDVPGSQSYPPFLRYFYPDRGDFVAFVSNLRSRRALKSAVTAFRAVSDFPCESAALPAADVIYAFLLAHHIAKFRRCRGATAACVAYERANTSTCTAARYPATPSIGTKTQTSNFKFLASADSGVALDLRQVDLRQAVPGWEV